MELDKKFVDTYFKILEYDISKGINIKQENGNSLLQELLEDEEEEFDGDEMEVGVPTDVPTEEPDAAESSLEDLEKEVETIKGKEDAKSEMPESEENIDLKILNTVEQLLSNHENSLQQLEQTIDSINQELANIKKQTSEISNLKIGIKDLDKRLKNVEPEAPIDTIRANIKKAGGMSVDEYWNDWYAKQGRNEKSNYYDKSNQIDGNEQKEKIYDISAISISDDDIKNILFGKNS